MANPFLSIIIPAYNEADRLPLTLIDINQKLSAADYDYEILVVSDGSTDNTASIVRNMAKGIKNLKLIDNDQNKGKGAAVRQGMLLAKGKIRLMADADNSTSIDHVSAMLARFNEGFGIVIGSRAVAGSALNPPEPIHRQIAGKIGNLIIQALLLPGIWDSQCGFKAFTEEAAEKIFSISRVSGWGFDAEALVLGMRYGYAIKEIPVIWSNNRSSRVDASAYLKTLLETCKIRLWLWTHKYPQAQNEIKTKQTHESR